MIYFTPLPANVTVRTELDHKLLMLLTQKANGLA